MLSRIAYSFRRRAVAASLAALATLGAMPAAAQMTEVDPNAAIDADLQPGWQQPAQDSGQLPPLDQQGGQDQPYRVDSPAQQQQPDNRYESGYETGSGYDGVQAWETAPSETVPYDGADPAPTVAQQDGGIPTQTVDPATTYKEDDLIGAAEGLFGKGAEGLARVIEDILSKQGEPNAYIVGREGSGAFVVGVRYGSGTLFHKVEGNRPVYWTGPSIGFDAGANAGNTFVLVYNLDDSEELYERFPAGEGQAYLVGGFTVSYMRKGNVVLIPIRVGAGLRLGVNAGYMRFSHKQRWLPF